VISETAPLVDFDVTPKLLGVRVNEHGSSAEGINHPTQDRLFAYAAEHPDVGMPLIGVAVGPCTSSAQCSRPRGELCIPNPGGAGSSCRAYPMIQPSGAPTFTGTSFWDKVTSELRFREDNAAGVPFGPTKVVSDIAIANFAPLEPELADRCAPQPVKLDGGVRASASPPLIGGGFESAYPVTNEEASLDSATADVELAADKFFAVGLVNRNGSYYLWNEQVPAAGEPSSGRTIHVCNGQRCTPPPGGVSAACKTVPTPACDQQVGGIWSSPPRPLAECGGGNCEETPNEFVSPDKIAGLPLIVFVQNPGASQFLNTKLHSVECSDETGWDAFGSDEFMIVLGSLIGTPPALPADEAIEEVANGFGAWTSDFDAGDKVFPGVFLSSLSVPFQSFAPAGRFPRVGFYGVMLGEDDDNIAQIAITTVLGLAGSFGLYKLFGAAGASGGGMVTAGILAAIIVTDPDDFLGQSAWTSSIPEVRERGLFSHDADPEADIELLPPVRSLDRELVGFTPSAMSHPAADGIAYDFDSQLRVCTTNGDCSNDRACVLNVCVPLGWADPTRLPSATPGGPPIPGTPGHVEIRAFAGSGARYSIRFATNVSDLPVPRVSP
jgi:hypothetical protein